MRSITELFAADGSIGIFLLVTVAMGGSAAWLAGRTIAASWRPWWHVVAFMLILALAVRFIHFSVFGSGFAQRLITQMYFEGDPLIALDPMTRGLSDAQAVARLIAPLDMERTVVMDAMARRASGASPANRCTLESIST